MKDFLAWINVGVGSSWGRNEDKEEAIASAIRSLRDWETLYIVADKEVTVRVLEVTGYDDVVWDDSSVDGQKHGSEDWEPILNKIEYVKNHPQ